MNNMRRIWREMQEMVKDKVWRELVMTHALNGDKRQKEKGFQK